MIAFVVALVVQVGWEILRAIVEHGGPPSEDAHVLSQAFGVTLATQLVLAATAVALARRLEGRARSGVQLAAAAYSAIALCTVARDVLVHTSSHAGYAWIMWMHEYGWSALEVLAIAGLTFAAGRRFWLAPPAAGLVILGGRPAFIADPRMRAIAIACIAVKVVLVLVIVASVDRPGEADRARAVRGMRYAEYSSWVGAVLALSYAFPGLSISSQYGAILVIGTGIVMNALWVTGAWSAAEARVGELPRWPLYVAATFTLWAIFRTSRVWVWTLIRLWDHFDQGLFTEVHWGVLLPGLIGTLAMYGALAVLARRARSTELLAGVAVATVCSGAAFGVALALHHHGAIVGAGYIASNLVAARMCRTARATLATDLPPARAL
ncbi:MAG TPA: hypothetical protein VIV58_22795 [Kofleriaceae bacterium]